MATFLIAPHGGGRDGPVNRLWSSVGRRGLRSCRGRSEEFGDPPAAKGQNGGRRTGTPTRFGILAQAWVVAPVRLNRLSPGTTRILQSQRSPIPWPAARIPSGNAALQNARRPRGRIPSCHHLSEAVAPLLEPKSAEPSTGDRISVTTRSTVPSKTACYRFATVSGLKWAPEEGAGLPDF